nr:MAG TPA: DNA polymerase I [Caudoviricetes sp.]
MKTLEIDIETFSSVNLAKAGVYRYVEAPDFEILLFGYSVDGGEVQVIDLASGEVIPQEILSALEDETVTKWAFNAQFERICLSRFLGYPTETYLESDSWKCSMVWSAYMGLPLSLEGVGAVLGLEKQKLIEGKDLIRYFCTPCKPTKANGSRTRNLSQHDKEKWKRFKQYNIRDVETEMQIQNRLQKFPVPDFVWDEYHLDQEINDRGILVDMDFVEKCIEIDGVSRENLVAKMQELTNLDNPNSVVQMKDWLSNNGIETETLGKKAVAALIDEVSDEMSEVLSLRQKLAKSSVRKYQAMQNSVCADNRVRGMFQFYGANCTGRFAGRLVQLQNLPQNHMQDLAEARGLVKNGDYEMLDFLYEDIPDTLSQLVRTAFIPSVDRTFFVADFSAIEARVITVPDGALGHWSNNEYLHASWFRRCEERDDPHGGTGTGEKRSG